MGMIFFLKSGRENICFFMHNAFLYILSGFAGMILIRTLILSFFEADFLSNLLLIAANETLSFIACSLLFIIMRRRKGYLVYLPDIYREKETDNKEDMKQGRFYSIRNM
jgi:hypothetical protein